MITHVTAAVAGAGRPRTFAAISGQSCPTPTTMKSFWLLSFLSLSHVLASPSPEQVVLSNNHLLVDKTALKNVANQFLSDAKKAILQGKKEMEQWYHDGKEFIKKNDLLCK